MWLMAIFWKSLRGMWRLVIGLIIGVIMYVMTFTTPGLEWIFNGVHAFAQDIHTWLSAQDWFSSYQKWDYLVKPADRLPLILYVLVGRFVWLLIEAALFSFPAWLVFGRKASPTPLGTNGIPMAYLDEAAPTAATQKVVPAVMAAAAEQASSKTVPTQAPPVQQGTGLETAIDTANVPDVPAEALASIATSKLAVGLDGLQEKAGNLERSIDATLERIDGTGGDKTS